MTAERSPSCSLIVLDPFSKLTKSGVEDVGCGPTERIVWQPPDTLAKFKAGVPHALTLAFRPR